MSQEKLILKLSEDIGVFNSRELHFNKNEVNITFAPNGVGKSTISDWIIRKIRNEKITYYDDKMDKFINIDDRITLNVEAEQKSYYLASSDPKIGLGKLHYINQPTKSLQADYMVLSSLYDNHESFSNFCNFFLTDYKFPKEFTAPKNFSNSNRDNLNIDLLNKCFESLQDLNKAFKLIEDFDKVILVLPKIACEIVKYDANYKVKTFEFKQYSWKSEGKMLRFINRSKIMKDDKNGIYKYILSKISDFYFSDWFEYLLTLMEYEFKVIDELKELPPFLTSSKKLNHLIEKISNYIFEWNIKNSKVNFAEEISFIEEKYRGDELLEQLFPDYNVKNWSKCKFHSLFHFSNAKFSIPKCHILENVSHLWFKKQQLFEDFEKSDLWSKLLAALSSLGLSSKTINISFEFTNREINIFFNGSRYDRLSKGQKVALDIQVREIAITNYFAGDSQERYLVIDDITEVVDKIKTDIFLRNIENLRAKFPNLTILIFTHDFSLINTSKYLSYKKWNYFSMQNGKLIPHKPMVSDKRNELAIILGEFLVSRKKMTMYDFAFLLRFFVKNEISKTMYIKQGINQINVYSVANQTNDYFHYHSKIVDVNIHISWINWLIDELLNICKTSISQLKMGNYSREDIEKVFSDVLNQKWPTTKSKLTEVVYINNFAQALYFRTKFESLFEAGASGNISEEVSNILIDSKKIADYYTWKNEIALLNQLIHVESHSSLIYSEESIGEFNVKQMSKTYKKIQALIKTK